MVLRIWYNCFSPVDFRFRSQLELIIDEKYRQQTTIRQLILISKLLLVRAYSEGRRKPHHQNGQTVKVKRENQKNQ